MGAWSFQGSAGCAAGAALKMLSWGGSARVLCCFRLFQLQLAKFVVEPRVLVLGMWTRPCRRCVIRNCKQHWIGGAALFVCSFGCLRRPYALAAMPPGFAVIGFCDWMASNIYGLLLALALFRLVCCACAVSAFVLLFLSELNELKSQICSLEYEDLNCAVWHTQYA